MDPVTAEKIAARRRYRRIRHVQTLLCCLEALSAFCLLSWSTARLPAAARLSAGLLRRVAPVLLGPRFVFLLGNAIVLALFAMSGRHPGSAAPSASGGEIHDQFLSYESRGIRSHAAGKEKAPRAWRRSRSERMERRRGHRVPELRRSKSEVSCQEVAIAATEKEEREADAEEFRRTIEAFISEQLRRFHREESTAAVVASAGTPDTTTTTTTTRVFLRVFKEEVAPAPAPAPLPRMALSAAVDTSLLLSAAAGRQSSKSGARPRSEKQASSFSPSFLRSVAPRFAGLSSALILRFPPNFVRQLSTKVRRNCCNIGVAQIVAASWSNSSPAFEAPRSAASEDAAVAAEDATLVSGGASQSTPVESPFPLTGEAKASAAVAKAAASLNSDGSLAVHAEIGLLPPSPPNS